jgi:hypothetical protein
MRRWTTDLVFPAIVILILTSCTAKGPTIGEQKIVETSSKKGKWVSAREDHFEKKGNMCFRGMAQRVQDLTLGRRQAEADAKKRIADSIVTVVRTEYEEYARGANMDPYDVSKFVADGVAWSSESIVITGVTPEESYWEKVRTTTYDGVQYFYNCWSLVKVPRDDYERARMMAVSGLIEKARASHAKAAEEAAIGLKQKLEQGLAPLEGGKQPEEAR